MNAVAAPARARAATRSAALPVAVALVAAVVIAVGEIHHAATGRLGTALPPFVSSFGVKLDPWAAVALVLFAAAPLVLPRLLAVPRSPLAFAALAFAAALALGLSLNAMRNGPGAWSAIFDTGPGGSFEAKNEYLPALPAVEPGIHYLLDRFALLIPSLPSNASAHPPGLLILLHATGIDSAGGMAALCIAAAAALSPLSYALSRSVGAGERTARTAALLAALSPVVLLFGVTSADALFAAAGTATAALLASRRIGLRAAGAVALALSALLSWALLAIGAWAVLLAWRRDGVRAALLLAGACGAAVLALQVVLTVSLGYDPLAVLHATEGVYRNSLARIRPYWFWVAGSPVAWLTMLGLPIAAAWLVAAGRLRPEALALAIVLAIAAVLGFTKAETERIWLPFAPLACVAAAPLLHGRRLRLALALLAAQAVVWETCFATIW